MRPSVRACVRPSVRGRTLVMEPREWSFWRLKIAAFLRDGAHEKCPARGKRAISRSRKSPVWTLKPQHSFVMEHIGSAHHEGEERFQVREKHHCWTDGYSRVACRHAQVLGVQSLGTSLYVVCERPCAIAPGNAPLRGAWPAGFTIPFLQPLFIILNLN